MPVKFMFDAVEALSSVPKARGMEVFAWGLLNPGHMEWTSDDRLLVSEYGRGRVSDITSGGDFRDTDPFAYGLANPAGLVTNWSGSHVLVADNGTGEILDITDGGDIANAPRVATDVANVYGIVTFHGDLYATYATPEDNGVVRVDAGGTLETSGAVSGPFPNGPAGQPVYASTMACPKNWAAVVAGNSLLYSHAALGSVYDVTDQAWVGPLGSPVVASNLSNQLGMWFDDESQLLFVAERGTASVKAIPLNSSVSPRFIPPIVAGFKEPSCVRLSKDRQSMFVCDTFESCVWKVFF